MPSLPTESISLSTGKRGRPRTSLSDPHESSAAQSEDDRQKRDLREDHEKAAAYVPKNIAMPTGEKCPRCNQNSERNANILRAYDCLVDKCKPCSTVWIEGDPGYAFDAKTAASGVLLRRAEIIWGIRNPDKPVPAVKGNVLHDLIVSDWEDPRWQATGERE